MTNKQDSLIYVEKEDKQEATFMSASFVSNSIRNRAYLNSLAAELIKKYLISEGIDVSDMYNIHSVSKILEKTDVSDILLNNIHIDVRVIFDENQIFIPKSHFDLGILPDVYAVVKFEPDFECAKFLGYFSPNEIDKNLQNNQYYFIESSKLSSPVDFGKFVKEYVGKSQRDLTEEDFDRARELSVALADHNISDLEYREFLELMLLNSSLREEVLEFDNFETLSYNTIPVLYKQYGDHSNEASITHFLANTDSDEEGETDVTSETSEEDLKTEDTVGEVEIKEEQAVTVEEETVEEQGLLDETPALDDFMLDTDFDGVELSQDEINATLEQEPEQEEAKDDKTPESETVQPVQPQLAKDINSLSVDDILDATIASIGTNDKGQSAENKNNNGVVEGLATAVAGATVGAAALGAEAAIVAGAAEKVTEDVSEAVAQAVVAGLSQTLGSENKIEEISTEEISDKPSSEQSPSENENKNSENSETQDKEETSEKDESGSSDEDETTSDKPASKEVIKLAGVAGEVIDEIVQDNVKKQEKNLDRIDYKKTDIYTDTNKIPENIAELAEFSTSKMEDNKENEASGMYDAPKDLNDLDIVEQKVEGKFVHETAAFEDMEVVDREDFGKIVEPEVEMCELADVDITADIGDLPLNTESDDVELLDMDIPGSSFSINEDGTSNFDDFSPDINFNNDTENNFVDLGAESPVFSSDDEPNMLNQISTPESQVIGLVDEKADDFQNGVNDFPIEKTKKEEELDTSFDIQDDFSTLDIDSDLSADFSIDEPEEENKTTTIPHDEEKEEKEEESIEDLENFFDEKLSEGEDLNVAEDIIEPIAEDEELEIADIDSGDAISSDVENEELEISEEDVIAKDNTDETSTLEDETTEELTLDDLNVLEDTDGDENSSTVTEQEDTVVDLTTLENEDQTSVDAESDWLESSDFSELQDVVETYEKENNGESVIVEGNSESSKEFAVAENSSVISDKDFKVGEISIDINNPEGVEVVPNQNLEELYASGDESATMLQNSGRVPSSAAISRKLPIGLGIAGVLVSLALVGAIGFGVSKMLKPSTDEAPQPITDEPITGTDNEINNQNTLNVNPENVVDMDKTAPVAQPKTVAPVAAPAKPAAATSQSMPVQKSSPTTFIEVQKLTWEVPDYVSYNSQFKQYFQSVGKSLKLALSSDLLLATDYVYTSSVRVSITFDKDGSFKNATMVNSSGSTQIDKIVLQTVNETLKSLKAPHSVGNDESTTAILKIYF